MKRVMEKGAHYQRGGTVLGLIIGLVVGLGIAVVVALMITKSSTPFTNKLGITKAADTIGVQLSDPNKPLYGNSVKEDVTPAKPPEENGAVSNGAISNVADVAKPPQPTLPPHVQEMVKSAAMKVESRDDAHKPEAKQDQKIDAKVANKSLDAAVSTMTKADAGDDGKWIYFLQVGAFRDAADAESARGKLALLGFESHTSERSSETGTLYRVRVGPFDQMAAMNRMRSKLSENSVDVAVIRTPKQ